MGITVLSLFDGMSCGQIALKELGIEVDAYYAAEIDKHAIKVTQHNFPNTIQLGDVTKVFAKDFPKIDLVIGGSPCQGFSFAGKGLNFQDPRSKLFFEFVRLVKECNPKYFLLENVKMKKEHEVVISQQMGVAPIVINSSLVSAQNRVRNYWTNINQKPSGLFGDMICDIPQPKDRGILLKDILETDVPDKYFLSEKMINYLNTRKANFNSGKINYKTENDVASCINASSGHIDISDNIIIDTNRKSRCFTAGGNSGGLHSQMDLIKCVAMRGRNPENPKSRQPGIETQQQLEPRNDGKTNCLTSVQKDNLVYTKNYLQYDVSGKGYKSQQDRAFYEDGKHGCLATARAETKTGIIQEGKIRRLTPTECARLQTIPDWVQFPVSDSQQYKMLGNGWTIEVIKHIISYANF
ncbi:MAG: DNA (cytosine-5-)-methyltransferase [Bacteroidia bacterium]|nr:DNA (cytosine-5-)-methyltransferase [Bacteroidia bacterium]